MAGLKGICSFSIPMWSQLLSTLIRLPVLLVTSA